MSVYLNGKFFIILTEHEYDIYNLFKYTLGTQHVLRQFYIIHTLYSAVGACRPTLLISIVQFPVSQIPYPLFKN